MTLPFPWRGWLAAATALAILLWSAQGTGFSLPLLVAGLPEAGRFFLELLPSREKPWDLSILPDIQVRLLETLRIALSASLLGALAALPFALIGARTLAPGRAVYALGRGLLNLIRTVPDLVLATLLAAAFGIGPMAGFLALLFFSFGVVAKLLCDTAETIDPEPMEAIAATGGTRLQQAVFAALPQVAPDFAAYALYSLEINVRAASVLGLVGAGGIGLLLKRYTDFMSYGKAGLIIAVIFGVVFLIDSFSAWLRGKLV